LTGGEQRLEIITIAGGPQAPVESIAVLIFWEMFEAKIH